MVNCVVLGCKSRTERNADVSFHRFPEKPAWVRQKWIKQTGRTNWQPSKHSRICSKHFEHNYVSKTRRATYLAPNSTPTLSTHNSAGDQEQNILSESFQSCTSGVVNTNAPAGHQVDSGSPKEKILEEEYQASTSGVVTTCNCSTAKSTSTEIIGSLSPGRRVFLRELLRAKALAANRKKKIATLKTRARRLEKKNAELSSVVENLKSTAYVYQESDDLLSSLNLLPNLSFQHSGAMWDVRACRSCLAVKGKLQKISGELRRLYTTVTGLQIAVSDGYPHYFCLECRVMLRKCLAFRRKSRRAHAVLKEIMSARKQQVTYSDIITVNRKENNLISSLGFWEPQKIYSIFITENEPPPDLGPTGPFNSFNTSVVDIKPDKDIFEEDRPPTPFEDTCDPPDDNDNFDDDDVDIKKELLDIDLNDVFKDIEDVDVDIVPTPEPKFEVKKEEFIDTISEDVDKMSVQTIVQALEFCDIKVMNLDEQKKRMEIKKLSEEFVHAVYKCAMCATVHATKEELIKHVMYHNRPFGHECQVCRNKYLTVEELNIHVARCHMYEYKCKCNSKLYCLQDIVRHAKGCKHLRHKKMEGSRRQRTTVSPLEDFTVVALTQALMHHVRELRRERGEEEDDCQPEVITEDDYKCDVCGKWLKTKKKMESHMTMKHCFHFTCNLCREVFTERLAAVKHGRTHRMEEKPWPCDVCEVVLKDHKSLSIHQRLEHNTKRTCNMCGQLFGNIKAYYRHQLTDHKYISLNDPLVGDPQYQCGDCGVQFIDKRSLETHLVIMKHAGAGDVEFACLPCKKLFENEKQLDTHYITCKNASKYPRKCSYCMEMMQDKKEYQKHYNTKHPALQYRYTTQNAICDICGKSIHKPHLEAHLKLHAGDSYACRHCDHRTVRPAAHVMHLLGHAGKPYRCAMCPRRFQHKGDARDHILKVHAPTKLYKCEFCDQEFSYFRHLKDHSEKLHNLIIPSIKNKCKKSNSKVFVYADMKIEITEEARDALEKTEVCLLDYLDQKSKPVDYNDYFIFLDDSDQVFRMQRKRPARDNEGLKADRDVTKPGEEVYIQLKYNDSKKGRKMKVKEIEPEIETENAVHSIAEEDREVEEYGGRVKMENQEVVFDEERPLEVFENDGKQFVLIGGEMYRIATDDEE